MAKEIEIILKPDGSVDFDQMGYKGKECHGDIDDLIKMIGEEKKNTKKKEYKQKKSININQNR